MDPPYALRFVAALILVPSLIQTLIGGRSRTGRVVYVVGSSSIGLERHTIMP
jgi:hypothetical protein